MASLIRFKMSRHLAFTLRVLDAFTTEFRRRGIIFAQWFSGFEGVCNGVNCNLDLQPIEFMICCRIRRIYNSEGI